MTLNFIQRSVNECLEILIIIFAIKYRPCIQLHLCTQWWFSNLTGSEGKYEFCKVK